MKKTIKYIAPLFAAAAIGAISLAPVESAASSPPPAAHSTDAPSTTTVPPASYGAESGPLVPGGTHRYLPYFPGMISLVS